MLAYVYIPSLYNLVTIYLPTFNPTPNPNQAISAVNIGGGFHVTGKMLDMFKRPTGMYV